LATAGPTIGDRRTFLTFWWNVRRMQKPKARNHPDSYKASIKAFSVVSKGAGFGPPAREKKVADRNGPRSGPRRARFRDERPGAPPPCERLTRREKGIVDEAVRPVRVRRTIAAIGRNADRSMAYGLSFSPEFFEGRDRSGDTEPPEMSRPRSVADAVMRLSQDTWNELAENVFGIDPSQLDLAAVLSKIVETNTCHNLDSPVEVYIDPDGDFTVHVYDAEPRPDDLYRQP
jgi:hypothetical protein